MNCLSNFYTNFIIIINLPLKKKFNMKTLAILAICLLATSYSINSIHANTGTIVNVKEGSKKAEFKLGDPGTYIVNNLKLSKEEIGAGGEAIVEFVINVNGNIERINFRKSYSKIVDAKIYDIVRNMNEWTPAMIDGKPVESFHKLPIILQSK